MSDTLRYAAQSIAKNLLFAVIIPCPLLRAEYNFSNSSLYSPARSSNYRLLYRVYKKKLNKFEIADKADKGTNYLINIDYLGTYKVE